MSEDEFLSLVSDMHTSMVSQSERAVRRPNGILLRDEEGALLEAYSQTGPSVLKMLDLVSTARVIMGNKFTEPTSLAFACGIIWGKDLPEDIGDEDGMERLRGQVMSYLTSEDADVHGLSPALITKAKDHIVELLSHQGKRNMGESEVKAASWVTGCMIGKYLGDIEAIETQLEGLK